jgi:branched-chain amino acid transport system ATP-binding protein
MTPQEAADPMTSQEAADAMTLLETADATTLLEVEALDVFHGDVQALWNISLSVAEAECVAVLGSNGAGKTTLLSTIAGLLRPTAGRIRYLGEEIGGLEAHRLCEQRLSLVPEGAQLFSEMTVLENLELGAYPSRARAQARVNLERWFELFPRLAERRKQLAGALSGGERQLLAIARALMSEPRLLLLDEPSLGLAPLAIEHVFDILARLRQDGLTILLVEQNVSHALELADRAYIVESGRVVRSEAAVALATDPDIRRHFLGL